MKRILALLVCLSLVFMCAFADGDKTKVEVKDIPKEVLEAATAKVKGFEAKSATVQAEDEGKEYEITGTADGKSVVIEVGVDKDGKVSKTEVEKAKEE